MPNQEKELQEIAVLYAVIQEELEALRVLRQDLVKVTAQATNQAVQEAIAKSLQNVHLGALSEKMGECTTQAENAALNAKQTALRLHSILDRLEKSSEVTFSAFVKPILTVFLPMMGAIVLGLALYSWTLPSASEIQTMRDAVADLESAGGKAVVSRCDGKPCVRVKTKKVYGEKENYLIIDTK